jgi:pentatricopeptide repeat protein
MTSYYEKQVVCGACGHSFAFQDLNSTNTLGAPDLDMRPAEMQRSTMQTWVQRCRKCGFCARDVSVFDERMRSVLADPEYQARVRDHTLLSRFACAGMLAEAAGNSTDAGWHYLSAAWDADDRDLDLHARYHRNLAADAFLRVLADGKTFIEEKGASEAVVVDCLRRAGRSDEAEKLLDQALTAGCGEAIAGVLEFQRDLIRRGDRGAHVVGEAPRGKAG